ncbi:hypothetical protein [Ferruginibacter sp.]|nr:hypothetical protein [Ferruginibacter sp.]
MKRYLLTLLTYFVGTAAVAQEINLSDSVIYFDNKPVAYYVKELNQSDPHYDIYIISLDMKLLIAARVVKFDAPIRELKPFYYYDLIFHNEKDTFSIYHEGQAFALEMASLLKKYNLLGGNKINKDSLASFKKVYNGNTLLWAKIKEYETYLNENRFFSEQTVRDRTKPVTIINDKIIMQDGKKIGLVVTGTNVSGGGGTTNTYTRVLSTSGASGVQIDTRDTQPNASVTYYSEILLPSNRKVNASGVIFESKYRKNKTYKPLSLYDISFPLLKESRNDDLLWHVCQLVNNYLL